MSNYIVQKSERIVSAIYLITDNIKDSDCIKWEIREEAISFVSNSHIMYSPITSEKDYAYNLFINSLNKINSLLKILELSKQVSIMNTNVISTELNQLKLYIEKNRNSLEELSGYVLSNSYFATDNSGEMSIDNFKNNQNKSSSFNVKNTSNTIGKMPKKDRQESIINLLKNNSNLTIKDFVKVITDCSEKTIQRELTDMVTRGLIKKEGERRWSKYSLI